MKSPIILRIFKNNQLIEVKQFDKDPIIFGQGGEASVLLQDEGVSVIHCLIELRDSGYYLCDMGSSSGTRKNGVAILDEPISSGDNIEVGPYRIQFFVGAPKPKAAPTETIVTMETTAKAETAPPTETVATKVQAPAVEAPAVPVNVQPAVKTNIPSFVPPIAPSVKAPKLPESASGNSSSGKAHKKAGGTFAPQSEIKDLGSYLKPTKGPVVEVIIAWQERVLNTYHFGGDKGVVTIGSNSKADIQVPSQFIKGSLPFLEMTGVCRVISPPEMNVELTNTTHSTFNLEDLTKNGKAIKSGAASAVRLEQGELLKLSGAGGTLQIFVRFVPNTVKPILAPSLDLSSGELTGLVVSLVIVALTALYMSVYTPPVVAQKEEEQVRLAQFIYNKPPPTTTTTMPEPEKRQVVEVKPPPTPPPPPEQPKKIKVTEEKKETVQQGKSSNAAASSGGKAADVRPIPDPVSKVKKFTSSVKQGGAVKLSDKENANAQSKDVTKVGLLSAFGGGGIRKQLDQAYSGSGELLGEADKATGASGQNANRAGDDIGSKFKFAGAGGKGTATQGIAGLGTKGRGSGNAGYGSGIGSGSGKGNVRIDAGGVDEGWEGTIDREAVRRVIRSILNQIKSCYERQLRVNSALEGKVVIQFEIMEQGRVRTAKTKSSTLGDSSVESCVASRIKEARFPEPPTGTIAVVDYPFVFGAQK